MLKKKEIKIIFSLQVYNANLPVYLKIIKSKYEQCTSFYQGFFFLYDIKKQQNRMMTMFASKIGVLKHTVSYKIWQIIFPHVGI